MTYRGEDLLRLIPQRNPFIMVDSLEVSGDTCAATTLTVRHDNYFMLTDGKLAETALIEHMAQSCSALAGHHALSKESSIPPVGIIGEVRHFVCHRRPHAGEQLQTNVNFDITFGNVTLATGLSTAGEELIAEVKLKIFMQ